MDAIQQARPRRRAITAGPVLLHRLLTVMVRLTVQVTIHRTLMAGTDIRIPTTGGSECSLAAADITDEVFTAAASAAAGSGANSGSILLYLLAARLSRVARVFLV